MLCVQELWEATYVCCSDVMHMWSIRLVCTSMRHVTIIPTLWRQYDKRLWHFTCRELPDVPSLHVWPFCVADFPWPSFSRQFWQPEITLITLNHAYVSIICYFWFRCANENSCKVQSNITNHQSTINNRFSSAIIQLDYMRTTHVACLSVRLFVTWIYNRSL